MAMRLPSGPDYAGPLRAEQYSKVKDGQCIDLRV
jgi:hypothetical protein